MHRCTEHTKALQTSRVKKTGKTRMTQSKLKNKKRVKTSPVDPQQKQQQKETKGVVMEMGKVCSGMYADTERRDQTSIICGCTEQAR